MRIRDEQFQAILHIVPVSDDDFVAEITEYADTDEVRQQIIEFVTNNPRATASEVMDYCTDDLMLDIPYYDDEIMYGKYSFYKNRKKNKVWWVDNYDVDGEHLFSFDRIKVFNLFRDYPHALTADEKAIFDAENPYWANFFSGRR